MVLALTVAGETSENVVVSLEKYKDPVKIIKKKNKNKKLIKGINRIRYIVVIIISNFFNFGNNFYQNYNK